MTNGVIFWECLKRRRGTQGSHRNAWFIANFNMKQLGCILSKAVKTWWVYGKDCRKALKSREPNWDVPIRPFVKHLLMVPSFTCRSPESVSLPRVWRIILETSLLASPKERVDWGFQFYLSTTAAQALSAQLWAKRSNPWLGGQVRPWKTSGRCPQ